MIDFLAPLLTITMLEKVMFLFCLFVVLAVAYFVFIIVKKVKVQIANIMLIIFSCVAAYSFFGSLIAVLTINSLKGLSAEVTEILVVPLALSMIIQFLAFIIGTAQIFKLRD
ncbi:hypothetical protein A6E00_15820 [Vibrio diabolicus]|uniref:hypothetical protein n=1 Tax=Vibrio diabolicus TaxID=50719 RepID=UPI00080F4C1E|nr:hypothetical protein [Vibrio diabolicus]EGR0722701.1 hypothetical protein [Vibrio alginolyticus]MBE4282394.1 hypothetical protein [Vibrio parahaemolyticus]OCH72545.1 hypothetical protein A6E00_15820 [Vibrio diabolicus]